jgi:hypothetical protein
MLSITLIIVVTTLQIVANDKFPSYLNPNMILKPTKCVTIV